MRITVTVTIDLTADASYCVDSDVDIIATADALQWAADCYHLDHAAAIKQWQREAQRRHTNSETQPLPDTDTIEEGTA